MRSALWPNVIDPQTERAATMNRMTPAHTDTALAFPAGSGETLLDLNEVGHTYRTRDGGGVEAIRSVTEQVRKGEFISILGPSGCGKSTLLMMIAGLLPTTRGAITLGGDPVLGPDPDSGIVLQDAVLFPWRTISRNIQLPGEIAGMPAAQRQARADELLSLVKLDGFGGAYPRELSGGMQQRAAIARSLMLSPSLLLMDEPFGALDAMTRDEMNVELKRICLEAGATVILVTHSISEAVFLSDRVMVLGNRPSTVREVVSIDAPRERGPEFVTTPAFGAYVGQLRALIGAEGEHA